jgi:mono/diheme cytochrome c family protein
MRRFLLAFLAASLFAAVCNAQAINQTPASNGKMMFSNYCASCHGPEGRGDGPVAASLNTPATDLTLLSKNNHGRFPDNRVASVLRFGVNVPAHGTAAMPIWGPILGWMAPTPTSYSDEETIRVSNLVRYLKTLQAK